MMTDQLPLSPGINQRRQQQQQQQQQPSLSRSFNGPFGNFGPNEFQAYQDSLAALQAGGVGGPPRRATVPGWGGPQQQQLQQLQQQQQQQQEQQQQQQQQQQMMFAPQSNNSIGPLHSGGTHASSAPSGVTYPGGASVTTASSSLTGMRSLPKVVITSPKHVGTTKSSASKPSTHKRSHPTSIVLPPSSSGALPPPSHPVPEFLCHLYSMLSDPSLRPLIGWTVPTADETSDMGGGKAGVGKVVVYDPTRLQDEVLGRYYRHSKYSSFQRQLNYFGFKKRLHGSRKGKMCPCSFVHDGLGSGPQSLLSLKRRPPSHKTKASDVSSTASGAKSAPGKAAKKRRPSHDKKGGAATSSPSTVSVSSASISTSPHQPLAAKNESWAHQSLPPSHAAPGGPLHMPSISQGSASLPGLPTLTASSNFQPFNNGMSASNNQNIVASLPKQDDISALRASNNAAVLEARKSLAENFLKSKRERPGEVVSSVLGPLSASMPGGNATRQQPSMMASNQFFNAAPGTMKVDNASSGMPGQTSMMRVANSLPGAPTSSTMVGKDWTPANPSLPTSSAPMLPNNFAAAQLSNTLLSGLFPGKAFDATVAPPAAFNVGGNLAVGNRNPYVQRMDSCSSDHIMQLVGTTETHPQGMEDTPPYQFSDLFSNLLSTDLPPSEDLFDDDMSAGNISDFGLTERALQVADDGGMMMPP